MIRGTHRLFLLDGLLSLRSGPFATFADFRLDLDPFRHLLQFFDQCRRTSTDFNKFDRGG